MHPVHPPDQFMPKRQMDCRWAAEQGEGITAWQQFLEQMFVTAQAAADAFSEINSPNEKSSKEMY